MRATEFDAPLEERRPPWKFELLFALVGLIFGLAVLPALIYAVGIAMLGPYPASGLAGFYGGLFADLAKGETRAWILALGPYLLAAAVRGIWLLRKDVSFAGHPRATEPSPESRVEPKVTLD